METLGTVQSRSLIFKFLTPLCCRWGAQLLPPGGERIHPCEPSVCPTAGTGESYKGFHF